MGKVSTAAIGLCTSLALCAALLPVPLGQAQVAGAGAVSRSGGTSDACADAVPGQLIVAYAEGASSEQKAAVSRVLKAAGAEEQMALASPDEEGGQAVQVSLQDDGAVDSAVEALGDMPGVDFAQRNYRYRLAASDSAEPADSTEHGDVGVASDAELTTNDPRLASQYALNSWSSTRAKGADVRSAWATAQSSDTWSEGSAEVAVLDTGITLDHEDLKENIDTEHMGAVAASSTGTPFALSEYFVEHGDTRAVRRAIRDRVGHGTHVAGIVSARANNGLGVAGVSYNAKILPVNVYYYSSEGKGYVTDSAHLGAALGYVERLKVSGAAPGLHVVNISAGGYPDGSGEWQDALLEEGIRGLANRHGVLTVCAGGNGNGKTAFTSTCLPSDFAEALSVTALDRAGDNASYSDYNRRKNLSAPGDDIVSTTRNGSYGTESGTSMAAPLVSGVAALMWQAKPDLSVAQVRAALVSTANKLDPEGNHYHAASETGSAGAVDADQAVRSVLGLPLKTVKCTKLASSLVHIGAGDVYRVSGGQYRVISSAKRRVVFERSTRAKSARTLVVPKSVKLADGRSYRIAGIAIGAFSGRGRLRTITVKSPLLKTKPSVKDCLRGSKVKTVKVRDMSTSAKKKVRAAFKKYAGKRGIKVS